MLRRTERGQPSPNACAVVTAFIALYSEVGLPKSRETPVVEQEAGQVKGKHAGESLQESTPRRHVPGEGSERRGSAVTSVLRHRRHASASADPDERDRAAASSSAHDDRRL